MVHGACIKRCPRRCPARPGRRRRRQLTHDAAQAQLGASHARAHPRRQSMVRTGSRGEMITARPVSAAAAPSSRMTSSQTRQAARPRRKPCRLSATSWKPSSQEGAALAVSCEHERLQGACKPCKLQDFILPAAASRMRSLQNAGRLSLWQDLELWRVKPRAGPAVSPACRGTQAWPSPATGQATPAAGRSMQGLAALGCTPRLRAWDRSWAGTAHPRCARPPTQRGPGQARPGSRAACPRCL